MPSATTAERRDSIAASKAITVAGPIKFFITVRFISKELGEGRLEGISPNLLPIVSTGSLNTITKIVVTIIAIKEPGIR